MRGRLPRLLVTVKHEGGENDAQCFPVRSVYVNRTNLNILHSSVAAAFQFSPLCAILSSREDTVSMIAATADTSASAMTTTTTITTITIEQLDKSQALEMVREISSRARESSNLDLILGANGKSGRSATGNYSLLAKAIGMTRVHVSRVLKGEVQPSHSTLRRLADATGFSLDEISGFILKAKEKRAA